jgi:CBS domain containing-hemolysin-like protein
VSDRTFDVDPRATFDELARAGFVYDASEANEPIGARVLAALGRLPRVGDKVNIGKNARATILGLSRRRITRLRIELESEPSPSIP